MTGSRGCAPWQVQGSALHIIKKGSPLAGFPFLIS